MRLALLAATAAISTAVLIVLSVSSPAGAEDASIGVDADPTGNTATVLGTIDACVEVATGDTFQVDIFVRDVTDLLAWSADLQTDPEIVQVMDRDVELFQAANEGSNVFDGSQQTPDGDGSYSLSAVDTADPDSPDSGSGILARVTIEALAAGVSPLVLAFSDIDDDGTIDRGPFLSDVNAEPIGDDNGDTFFDGAIDDARVAVDTSCSAAFGDDDDDGLSVWVIVAVVLGAAAALAVIGFAAIVLRGRRPSAA